MCALIGGRQPESSNSCSGASGITAGSAHIHCRDTTAEEVVWKAGGRAGRQEEWEAAVVGDIYILKMSRSVGLYFELTGIFKCFYFTLAILSRHGSRFGNTGVRYCLIADVAFLRSHKNTKHKDKYCDRLLRVPFASNAEKFLIICLKAEPGFRN